MTKFPILVAICLTAMTLTAAAAPSNPAIINEALFQDAINIPVSLLDMSHICRSVGELSLHIAPDVYSPQFTENTKVYLHNVRTLKDAMDDFTQSVGLHWRMASAGQIEVYRQANAAAPTGR